MTRREPPSELAPVTALDRWVEQVGTRDAMVTEYLRLLRENGAEWHGWTALNLAIMDRWSMSGLRWIKNRAWRLFDA